MVKVIQRKAFKTKLQLNVELSQEAPKSQKPSWTFRVDNRRSLACLKPVWSGIDWGLDPNMNKLEIL